jgi:hypothetical protein
MSLTDSMYDLGKYITVVEINKEHNIQILQHYVSYTLQHFDNSINTSSVVVIF